MNMKIGRQRVVDFIRLYIFTDDRFTFPIDLKLLESIELSDLPIILNWLMILSTQWHS